MTAVSKADAMKHLNLTDQSNQLDELDAVIEAAIRTVEHRVGPLEPRSITARVSGGGALVLEQLPVVSVTSVNSVAVGGQVAVPVGTDWLAVDPDTGVVTGHEFPAAIYEVTYTAGWDPTPEDLKYAVLELIRHMWKPQRRPMARPGAPTGGAQDQQPGMTFLIPNAVASLLEPYSLPAVG